MRTGNIKVSPEVIERIKQLPFVVNTAFESEKYISLGYSGDIFNRHEQYGTGDAVENGIEWQWTDVFSPAGWQKVGLQLDRAYTGNCIPPHQDHYNYY